MSNAKSVSAGRGLVFITAAKLWFMVAGYVVQFALPRALGSPARYGVYILVLSILSPVNNVMVQATIQGVSKFTAEIEERQGVVLRVALRLQSLLGGGVALAFFLAAPLLAWLEHDRSLTPYLQLATGVALAYAFYAVFVGAANGRREFQKQAGLDMTYSTLRCLFIVGAAALTHAVMPAVGGFVAAAVVVLVVSIFVVGFGKVVPGQTFASRELVRFFSGVAFYLFIVNLLMFADGLLLQRVATEWADAHRLADPSSFAHEQVGFYGAVQNVARIPFQLILAVTYVIFPLISKSTFDDDHDKTRGYVRNTMRYSLVVAALLAAVLAARPESTMRLFYKPEYAVGAHALAALVAGYVSFSLFNIAGTIINGSGRTLPTTIIGVVTLATTVAAEWIGIRWALEHGRDPLFVAAVCTAVTMTFGLLLSIAYLWRAFGAALPVVSVVRVAIAYMAALATGWAWNHAGLMPGKIGTLVACSVVGIVYLVVCVATGELRPAELKRLRR